LPGPALVILTLLLLLSSSVAFVFFNQERILGFDGALTLHRPQKGKR
jgi:hypothetical protein